MILYGCMLYSGPTTVTTPDRIRFKSSGRAFNGVEIKVDKPDDLGVGEVRAKITKVKVERKLK